MREWKVLARHKWVDGATISESVTTTPKRRFTATIHGYRNWLLYEGEDWDVQRIIRSVRRIRDRIDANDETVFHDRKETIS